MINRRDFLRSSVVIALGSSMPLLSSANFLLNSSIPQEATLTESYHKQKSERCTDIRSLDFDSHEFDLRFRREL